MSNVACLAALLASALLATPQALAQATADGAKKELVARILKLQQPEIETIGRMVAEQPALQLMQQAGIALQRLPPERREAVARDIEADLRQYAEAVTPITRERAVKLAPGTIGVMLEERFSEDELRQLAVLIESPTYRKFQGMAGDLQRSIGAKLVAETRSDIEPRLRALQQTIGGRLGIAPPAAASAPAAKK